MNHVETIHQEFVKFAQKWNDLTLDEQKRYLRRHPGSKRRITARPHSGKTQLDKMIGVKRVFTRLKRLERLSDKFKDNGVTRTKVYWVLQKAIKEGERPTDNPRTYNLNVHWNEDRNKLITKRLNSTVNRLTSAVEDLDDKYRGGKKSALKYIKTHFLINRKVKGARSVDDMEKAEPKKVKVKKTKKPDYVSIGDRVRLSNDIEITVTRVKHLSGRGVGVIVYGDTDEGTHWHSRQRSSGYGNDSRLKFLGKTDKREAERQKQVSDDFYSTLSNEKEKKKIEGREKINRLGITRGSVVKIRGPRYNWDATVVDIDYRQGGVRIDQQRSRRQRGSFFSGIPGNVTTHYRFIPGSSIVEKVR